MEGEVEKLRFLTHLSYTVLATEMLWLPDRYLLLYSYAAAINLFVVLEIG